MVSEELIQVEDTEKTSKVWYHSSSILFLENVSMTALLSEDRAETLKVGR